MRLRDVSAYFPCLSRVSGTERRRAGAPAASSRRGAAGRPFAPGAGAPPRRLVRLILETRGIGTAEAVQTEEVWPVARRVPIRGIVADLLLADPGVADLLTRLTAEKAMRQLPVLLVGPGAISPGQQRDLCHELARWSREQPVPLSELAAAVAEAAVGLPRAGTAELVVGEGGWHGR